MTAAEIMISAGDDAFRLKAAGSAAAASLAKFGQLLGSSARPPTGVRPDAELREQEIGSEEAMALFSIRSHRAVFDAGVPVLCRREPFSPRDPVRPAEWRLLLALAAARAAADGRRIALLHGALLDEPFPGTVLFGVSGVGKSTTMTRYRAAGGHGSADDLILLGWQGDVPVVWPLPSWKTFRNDPELYAVPAVPLSRLLCLDRATGNEEEHIRPLDRQMFRLRLVDALLEHVFYTIRVLPDPERSRASGTLIETAQRLSRQFEPRLLAARLDGDIMKTLALP